MINFSDIHKPHDVAERIHKKVISNETEYASVENPLGMHRTASNDKDLVSEIPNIINDENIVIAPGQEKNQFHF